MAMNYNAKRAEGADLPIGTFDATIVDCRDAVSKAGNQMLKMRIDVGENYEPIYIHLLCMFSSFDRELKAIFDAVGGYDTSKDFEFEPGDLAGKRVKIITRRDGEFNGQPQIVVERWVPASEVAATLAKQGGSLPKVSDGSDESTDDKDNVPF